MGSFILILLMTAFFQLVGAMIPWLALKRYSRHINKFIIVEVIIMIIISLELIYVGLSVTLLTLVGVLAGVIFVMLMNKFVPHKHESRLERLSHLVFIAMCMHELPEGMAFGSSYVIDPNVGLLTAILVSLHNIPEGSIVSFPMMMKGKIGAAMTHAGITQFLYVIGGLVTYILLISVSEVTQTMLMTFAAGAMLFIAFEELKFLK